MTAPELTELSVAAYADTRGGHVHVLLCEGPGPAVHVEVTEESS